MENKIRALLVQNRLNSITTLEKGLFAEGISCSIEKCDFSSDVISILEKNRPDVVLINLTDNIPDAIDLCKKISTNFPEFPVIVLADEKDERAALAAMKEGADDYVLFGQIRRLAASILRAIKLHRLQTDVKKARLAEMQARRTLRQTRIAKRLLSEQTSDLICEILPNGTIAYINKPLGEGLGYSVSELLGKSPLVFVHPEDRPLALRAFREALEERKGKQMSLRCRHKNGEWRYFQLSGDWIFNEEGNPLKAVVVLRDVTDKLKVQEALELSKKYASSIINSSLDMIIAADIHRNIIEFNPAAEKTFGYKKEEVLGKPVDILYVDSSLVDEIQQILLNKGSFVREVVNVRKNGEKFVSLLSASILRDLSGKIIGMMGVARDISVEKKIQEELEKSQNQLKHLVESVNVIPWEKDSLNGRIVYIGKQVEKILGYPAERWQTPDFWESHIYPEDRNYVINYSLSSADKFDNYEIEYRIVAADGRIVWVQDIVNVERKGGIPVRLRGFMIDITTRKEIEERLRQTNLTLEALIDTSPLGIIVIDMDGVVQVWNQSAEKILGWESYEIQGKQVPVELADEIPDDFDNDNTTTLESLFYCKEKQLHRKDGSTVFTTL
ncbi:MAG TPA: PAS domain S-box protein, partial [Verrucomicrobiota bacterium]|nr:PAS domain S-box protein [Verrucomicrobiota bacterium]